MFLFAPHKSSQDLMPLLPPSLPLHPSVRLLSLHTSNPPLLLGAGTGEWLTVYTCPHASPHDLAPTCYSLKLLQGHRWLPCQDAQYMGAPCIWSPASMVQMGLSLSPSPFSTRGLAELAPGTSSCHLPPCTSHSDSPKPVALVGTSHSSFLISV